MSFPGSLLVKSCFIIDPDLKEEGPSFVDAAIGSDFNIHPVQLILIVSHNTRLIVTKAGQIFQQQPEIPSPVVARCGHNPAGLVARVVVLSAEIKLNSGTSYSSHLIHSDVSIPMSDCPANEWFYEFRWRCSMVV